MNLRSPDLRRTLRLLVPLLLLGLVPASPAQAVTVTVPGNPLTIFVGDTGRVTARQAGDVTNVFFAPGDTETPNAGFNLGFPAGLGLSSEPITYGPTGFTEFESVSPGVLEGAGTAADPYVVTTEYRAPIDTSLGVEVTQVVTYVNGARRFAISYTVQNVTGAALRFRAGEYADLYLSDDSGTGFLNAGPPRLVGGVNVSSGRAGGIEEVAGSPWDRFQTGSYSLVRDNLADLAGAGLTNAVDPSDVDNGVAVQWDDFFGASTPLGTGQSATFNTAWSFSQFAPPQPIPPVDNSIDAQLARLPAPRLGRSVNVAPVKGEVYVKLPKTSATAAVTKGRGFVKLSEARQIPVRSLLDTRGGTVRLVSSAGGTRRQQGDFSGGFFTALQNRRGRGLTELRMARGKFSVCSRKGKRAQASRSKRRIRRLRGNAKGRFRTRGKYSSATVRGTDWTVTDRCDGTLTKVRRGSVVVRSLRRKKKSVVVRAPRSKLVRAPR